MPTSRVFRSRYGALRWSFWVIVAAVTTVGFTAPSSTKSAGNTTTDATGTAVNDTDVQALVNQLGG